MEKEYENYINMYKLNNKIRAINIFSGEWLDIDLRITI